MGGCWLKYHICERPLLEKRWWVWWTFVLTYYGCYYDHCGFTTFVLILAESNKLWFPEKIVIFFFFCFFLFACTHSPSFQQRNPILLCDREVGFVYFCFAVTLKAEWECFAYLSLFHWKICNILSGLWNIFCQRMN